MPSFSKKQHNFMEAVANNPKFAKKAGVSQSVGKDFEKADKGMKFRSGGRVKRYESGGSTYGGGGEGYIESPDTVKYSLDDVMNFFGLRNKTPAPIETRRGSPKPSIKANVSDEDALGSARQKLGDNDPSGIVKLPASVSSSNGNQVSQAGPRPSGPPPVQSEMIEREKGGDNTGPDSGNGQGSSGFTTTAVKPAASSSASSSNAPRPAAALKYVRKSTPSNSGGQGRSASAYQNYDAKEAGRSAERSQERERLKNYDYRKDAVQPDTTLEEAASYLLGGAGAVKGLLGLGKATVGKLLGSGAKSGSLKSQAINEVNAARAAAGDARGPVSGAISPKGTGPSKEAKRLMGEEIEPAAIKPTGQGPSQAGKDLMERSGTRQNKVAPEAESAADKARRLISERKAADKKIADEKAQAEVDKQLEEARRRTQPKRKSDKRLELQGLRGSKAESLNAKPSGPESKYAKGGKVKAFAKGGFVRKSADGCAQRGKTRGQIR